MREKRKTQPHVRREREREKRVKKNKKGIEKSERIKKGGVHWLEKKSHTNT